MDGRVHSYLRSVFCQILHYWCDCAGGGSARGAASGCHYLPGIFSQGKEAQTDAVHLEKKGY